MRLATLLGLGMGLACLCACGEDKASDDDDDGAAVDTCAADQTYAKVARPFFEDYCLSCHSEATSAAGGGHAFESLGEVRDHGHIMFEYLTDKTMPPKNSPQPTAAERQAMIDFLECSGAAEGGEGGHSH